MLRSKTLRHAAAILLATLAAGMTTARADRAPTAERTAEQKLSAPAAFKATIATHAMRISLAAPGERVIEAMRERNVGIVAVCTVP